MAQISVESLSKDEESLLRELAEQYANPQFLDFQDIPAVEMMAKGLARLLVRVTAKQPVAEPAKKVKFIQ